MYNHTQEHNIIKSKWLLHKIMYFHIFSIFNSRFHSSEIILCMLFKIQIKYWINVFGYFFRFPALRSDCLADIDWIELIRAFVAITRYSQSFGMGVGMDAGLISITYPLTHTSTHPINWVAGTGSKPFFVFFNSL
jgi:hypothetical protein